MRDLLVLCYHAVSPTWPAALCVTPAALDAQMADLAQRGYRGAQFTDVVEGRVGGRALAVTFDDNYRSVMELAKPILDRYGFPGTLFVPTAWPDDRRPMRWAGIDRWLGTEHEPEMESLTWEELRGLADAGWEIGSHTCSHPHLTQLDDAALARELSESKARIEAELSRPCVSIAYPYGDVDERVAAATAQAGYRAGGTIPRILRACEPLLWTRTPIFHVDDMRRFRRKVSPVIRHLRSSRPGVLADRVRVAFVTRGR
jgi:peptidoglycan/xylan/chitin deacetylase (PgdA/CDA1 family)